MKKILTLTVLLTLVPFAGFSAAGPKYFAFDLSTFGAYAGDVQGGNAFGVTFTLDQQFFGGFSFYKVGVNNITSIKLGIYPIKKFSISLVAGDQGGNLVFGFGFAYDIFTRTNILFTSMSIIAEWLGTSSTGAYPTSDGGLVALGLKVKFGL